MDFLDHLKVVSSKRQKSRLGKSVLLLERE